jgi:UDP-N-acetylglucosamine 4,6-dehydratase
LSDSGKQKTYLITGGTGSLGTQLTLTLLKQGHKVRALARSEHGHEKLRAQVPQELHPQLSSLVGAVEDLQRLHLAARGVDFVIHAAAQKAIPLAEYNPRECTLTNILGTLNVIDACLNSGVKRAVLVSTDKASAPATLYGFTKATAERLWLNANRYSAGNPPHFAAVRYGNVFASQGSVIHAWKKQAAEGKQIEITDPQCTRFHIPLAQAVSFVLAALGDAESGELWVPKLPSYRIGDLAHAFRAHYSLREQPSISGLRLSEKLHESMISGDEWPSLKAEDRWHFTLEPGVIHRKERMEYSSGMNPHKLGVEALTEEIRAWTNS